MSPVAQAYKIHIAVMNASPGLPIFDEEAFLPWRDELPNLAFRDSLLPHVDAHLLIHALPDADK
jgi:hypothetical protein